MGLKEQISSGSPSTLRAGAGRLPPSFRSSLSMRSFLIAAQGVPEFGFPGLKPGDRWCLCAPRLQEALEAKNAPRVVLRATHEGALTYCKLADLKRLAVDLA